MIYNIQGIINLTISTWYYWTISVSSFHTVGYIVYWCYENNKLKRKNKIWVFYVNFSLPLFLYIPGSCN